MAKKQSDFKEYSRLRDIVVKRNKRAVEAGLMPVVHFPTVKEIKAGIVTESEARRYVEEYYSSGSQVKSIRQTGLTPEVRSFRELPQDSEGAKKAKRKRQQREYRQRRRIRTHAPTPEKAERLERFLKGARSFANKFTALGLKPPFDPDNMTPKEAQLFAEYMDYRFSQGDYDQKYVIDEFIMDYAKIRDKYSPETIVSDFEKFVEDHTGLEERADQMEGLTSDEFDDLWSDFANAPVKKGK